MTSSVSPTVGRSSPTTPIIVAFDCDSLQQLEVLADQLSPALCRAKVGKQLFTTLGPQAVDCLHRRGFEVFLDLKFHDIPNTVAEAVRAASAAGVWMVNVHASGGLRMMEAAANVVAQQNAGPLLIAVTVLTSMEQADLAEQGIQRNLEDQVLSLAGLAQRAGLDGVVCSAQETQALRATCGEDFVLVTPGIRPVGTASGDQRRVVGPADALAAGSSYLVIGRPITQAEDPGAMLKKIASQLD